MPAGLERELAGPGLLLSLGELLRVAGRRQGRPGHVSDIRAGPSQGRTVIYQTSGQALKTRNSRTRILSHSQTGRGSRGHLDWRKKEVVCIVRNARLKYQAGGIAQKHRGGTELSTVWWLEQHDQKPIFGKVCRKSMTHVDQGLGRYRHSFTMVVQQGGDRMRVVLHAVQRVM